MTIKPSVDSKAMYPAERQLVDSPRSFPPHERQNSAYQVSHMIPQPSPGERPRPIEPRPAPPQPPTEAAMTLRQQDPFRGLPTSQQEPRSSGQSLPRLQDILAPGPNDPRPAWSSANPPAHHVAHHGYGAASHIPWHPAQPRPAQESATALRTPQPGRSDPPILDMHATRPPQDSPFVHPSSYPAYTTNVRDVHDHHREIHQPSPRSNYPHGSFPPDMVDRGQFRTTVPGVERVVPHGIMHQGQEISQLTYLTTEEIPGQGKFHVYQDGIRIPAEVDGETVNPAWGLTKANKPRKRMPKACLDCREKKVKCDPGSGDTCVQCERAKRPCRKEAPVQTGQAVAGSPPAWPQTIAIPDGQNSFDHTTARPQDVDAETLGRRRPREVTTGESQNKKQRSASPTADQTIVPPKRVDSVNHLSPPAPRSPRQTLCIDEDPYIVDRQSTLELLELFFNNVNDSTYYLFPNTFFIYWVKTSPDQKSAGERLVLYSILALGSVFVTERLDADRRLDERLTRVGGRSAQIAIDTLNKGIVPAGVLTAQARLIMALYQHAHGLADHGKELLVAAISTLTSLRLNTESACVAVGERQQEQPIRYEYRFDAGQIAECRRRTTWTAFMMERYLNTSFYHMHTQDLLIRLPCADQTYEVVGQSSNAPFLASACNDERAAASSAHPLASLIPIVAIWGDADAFIAREQHSSREHYVQTYQGKYAEFEQRLQQWSAKLPEHFSPNPANFDRSIDDNCVIAYISMLTLYYSTIIKLCRHYKHRWLPQLRPQRITQAHESAHNLLGLLKRFRDYSDHAKQEPHAFGKPSHIAAAPPYIGYAIFAAADILGAGGIDESIYPSMDKVGAGMGFLQEMYSYWIGARDQFFGCRKRYYQLQNLVARPIRSPGGCWVNERWGVELPMDTTIPSDYDCIYGSGTTDGYDPAYFDAFARAAPPTLRF